MAKRVYSFLLLALFLVGCGGKSSDNGGSTPSVDGNVVPPITTSVTVSDLTITRTLQPGVIELAESEAQSLGPTVLQMPTSRTTVTPGKVVTWKDRGYVVSAVSPGPGGGAQLTVRDASYSEVLSDLTVKGDLDMSNLDVSRIEIDAVSDGTTASVFDTQSPPSIKTLATSFKQDRCEGTVGDRAKGEFSEIKCTIRKRDDLGFQIALDVGVRDLFLRGVDIRPLAREISISNFTATPYIRLSVSVLNEENKPQNIEKSFPVLSVQVPVASTFGFVSFAIPVSVEVSLPLFKFSVSAEASAKRSNETTTFQGSIDTPVATLGTASVFKYDAKGQVYAVVGTELALTQFPHVRPLLNIFKESLPDRLLSAGVFYKKGFEGALSVNVEEINSKPCFTWSLQGKAGSTGVGKLGANPILELSALTNFGPVTSGSNGCEGLGPSPGGFSMVNLTCKRNTDGSASITGLYSAELAPGEQITVAAWSTEFLTSPPSNTCLNPTYTFPDNRQFGVPGEYINSTCTPPDGLSLNPSSFAQCHNPLSGTTRNIWTRLNDNLSSTLANGGSVLVKFCRATTLNLNPTIPAGARPTISLEQIIACSSGAP